MNVLVELLETIQNILFISNRILSNVFMCICTNVRYSIFVCILILSHLSHWHFGLIPFGMRKKFDKVYSAKAKANKYVIIMLRQCTNFITTENLWSSPCMETLQFFSAKRKLVFLLIILSNVKSNVIVASNRDERESIQ